MKRPTPFRSEAKHPEMFVQRSYILNSEAAHHSEAGAIDYREILIAPRKPDFPRGFQVGQANGLDGRHSAPQAIRKPLCSVARNSVMEQRPGLDQHMIPK
jgi:hypothetical protein